MTLLEHTRLKDLELSYFRTTPKTWGVTFSQRPTPLQAISNMKKKKKTDDRYKLWRKAKGACHVLKGTWNWLICKLITQQNTNCEETNGVYNGSHQSQRDTKWTWNWLWPSLLIFPSFSQKTAERLRSVNKPIFGPSWLSLEQTRRWGHTIRSTAKRDLNFGTCADLYGDRTVGVRIPHRVQQTHHPSVYAGYRRTGHALYCLPQEILS